MTVYVPPDVYDGLEAVRSSGETNMFDYTTVQRLCYERDHHAAVVWLEENKSAYAKGLSQGIEPADDLSGEEYRID